MGRRRDVRGSGEKPGGRRTGWGEKGNRMRNLAPMVISKSRRLWRLSYVIKGLKERSQVK